MKGHNSVWAMLFSLGLLVLPAKTQALNPAPDGSYSNFTTAEGQNALLHLSTGAGNTAVGWFSLDSVTTGSFNTGVGAGTLALNTGDENTAVGSAALLLNTASGNTAVGSRALLNNTTGGALGNVGGDDVGPNVAVGQEALKSNTLASANTAVGYQALQSFSAGIPTLEQRGLCTAVGFQALANTDGRNGGGRDCGFGYQALFHNIDGFSNVAIGAQAMFSNETGSRNTVIGGEALLANVSGSFNTVIGNFAGGSITGDGNVCIGYNSDAAPGVNNTTHIANIGDTPQGGGLPVTVDPSQNNQLGYVPSSRRYKEGITPMGNTSEAIFALKPVSFRYNKKIDPAQTRAFGLIAEEVEKVDPNLVARNKKGEPESVRYEQINAMLLNEFLKEHKKVQQMEVTIAGQRNEFEAKIAELKQEIERVAARSKDQDQQIQKAKARVEANGSVLRVIANEP